jgi:hypothetical protein
MDLATEQYKISEEAAENLLTRPPDITKSVNEAALHILEAYVRESSQQYYNVCPWLIKHNILFRCLTRPIPLGLMEIKLQRVSGDQSSSSCNRFKSLINNSKCLFVLNFKNRNQNVLAG